MIYFNIKLSKERRAMLQNKAIFLMFKFEKETKHNFLLNKIQNECKSDFPAPFFSR